MSKWVSVKTGMPNEDIACVVLIKDIDTVGVYAKFTEWDGRSWVDVDGDIVTGVIAWQKAPDYNPKLEELLSRVFGCYANDKCEETDCCYFARCSDIAALVEYMNDKEE